MVRKKSCLCILFLPFGTLASTLINIDLSTDININNVYFESITLVEFKPSNTILELDENKHGFRAFDTSLNIETSISRDVSSISYNVILSKNESFCFDYAGNMYLQDDFVDVYFEKELMAIGSPIYISDFNSILDEMKSSVHEVSFSFKPFSSITTPKVTEGCRGEIVFNIAVDV
ncbi:hypothetical protein ABRZ68_12035 [Vibrio vulnificus]|uniref:hypothetical protein n=1 Tax=Vibrio vulnificus TaxID=672 RepID=UPI001A1A5311|nr:hypothetical protein [Vibrio vulnificus]HAS6222317.1 hypothetical protein [Vibrio vulnificus]